MGLGQSRQGKSRKLGLGKGAIPAPQSGFLTRGSIPDTIDLAQFDDDFAQAEVEEREFETIPDGKYRVNVERVELTRAQTSGNPMLKWTLRPPRWGVLRRWA